MSHRDLEDLKEDLEEIKEKIVEEIALEELMDDNFMEDHTDFFSVEEFLTGIKYDMENFEELEEIDEEELDIYVAENTQFNTWEEMLERAKELYLGK